MNTVVREDALSDLLQRTVTCVFSTKKPSTVPHAWLADALLFANEWFACIYNIQKGREYSELF